MTAANRRKLLQTNAGWPRTPSQHRACAVCGQRFSAYLITRRFCSDRCRKAAWRAER
jgi:hypothetical protein